MAKRKQDDSKVVERVSLKTLAAYLNLDPTTISVVLNDVPGRSIPEATRDRIRKAAPQIQLPAQLPGQVIKKSPHHDDWHISSVLADGYHAEVMTGIGDRLLDKVFLLHCPPSSPARSH